MVRRLVLVLVMALLAGCTVQVPGAPSAGDVERLGPKGVVPPGLERFYEQSLAWQDCLPLAYDAQTRDAFAERGVRCAQLTVPLDYSRPDTATATIGVLRKPATGQRTGALVMNPGGPGVSGMVAAVSIGARMERTELGERFDLIGFDPRGIGVSRPLIRCMTASEMDADRVEPAEDTVAEVEAENQDYAAKCAARSGGAQVLANMGTRDVVRDMDVLRSVLGEEKLTYLGYSYGTRIGTAYAEAFTGNVRAMVLDGAVDPEEDPVAQSIGQAQGFDKALEAFLTWCRGQRACEVDNRQELQGLVDRLEQTPMPVGARKLSSSDVTTGVAAALYDDQTWPFLSEALASLVEGDGAQVLLLADAYLGRDESGEYNNTTDALIAVRCVDEPRTTDRAAVERQTAAVAEATKGTFLAGTDPQLPALDVCAFWPAPNTAEPHQPKVAGLPPTLVISTTGDPATPYAAGVELAKDLNARLVTYEATQHTAFLQRVDCVDEIGIRYLVDLTLPAQDTTCRG